MREVSCHYAERACPETDRLMHQGLQYTSGAQVSDPQSRKHALILILLKIEILPYG